MPIAEPGAQARIVSYDSLTAGRFEGASDGPASVSIIVSDVGPGEGPRLHAHPYDETWVIERGRVLFRVGNTEAQAAAGDIVVAPPGTAHKFTNQGPGRARLICVHASPTMQTEFFE
jgi:mannose-6-phosphate isomerase-like protein (cupin superfamily)